MMNLKPSHASAPTPSCSPATLSVVFSPLQRQSGRRLTIEPGSCRLAGRKNNWPAATCVSGSTQMAALRTGANAVNIIASLPHCTLGGRIRPQTRGAKTKSHGSVSYRAGKHHASAVASQRQVSGEQRSVSFAACFGSPETS